VILFTDGVPTKQSDFDTTVANGAIQSAKALKDAGATVYSVGIFNGANPEAALRRERLQVQQQRPGRKLLGQL